MPFSVGTVIGAGLRMWRRSLWRHAAVIVVGYSPVLALIGYVVAQGSPAARDEALRMIGDPAGAAILLLELPITAIVTHAVVGELRGRRPSRGASIRAGLRRTPHAALVMALIYLVMMATGFVAALPIAGADTLGGVVTVALIMVMLWAAYALSLAARWAVAVPAAVMERPGIVGALRRSGRLTAGRRWRLAALVVLLAAIHVGVLLLVVNQIEARYDPRSVTADVAGWAILLVLWMPLSILRAALAATAYAFIVEDVEGDSPERLGDVFA